MKEIKVKNETYSQLSKLCERLKFARASKVTSSAVIFILLKFAQHNKTLFNRFLAEERRFPPDYRSKLTKMQIKGIPTTRDIKIDDR